MDEEISAGGVEAVTLMECFAPSLVELGYRLDDGVTGQIR
jgi:hypothetical protein